MNFKELLIEELKLLQGRCGISFDVSDKELERFKQIIQSRIREIEDADIIIPSTWIQETAHWNGKEFVDKKETTVEKLYRVKIDRRREKPTLKFMDGPTGYEEYNIDSFKDDIYADFTDFTVRFCINAGTINSWPKVTVNWSDVKPLVDAALEELDNAENL